MNNIGSRIKKLREEKGITQDLMAYELNMTQSNYGRLEKDDRRLNVPKIEKIADVLNLSISIIFGEKSDSIQETNKALRKNEIITQQDNEHIISLKEEIIFLRKFLEKIVS